MCCRKHHSSNENNIINERPILLADVFPQPFEGCKLAINKGLSNHFQVSHTLQLSGMGPGAYHFGATYVGNKQTGPNEVQVVFYMYFHIVLGAAAVKGTPGAREFSWLL